MLVLFAELPCPAPDTVAFGEMRTRKPQGPDFEALVRLALVLCASLKGSIV